MAMVVPIYKGNEGNISNPRDASFSSYLDANERDFVRNLANSVHSLSPTREVASSTRVSSERNRIPRNELGVFGAERYFNEKLDHVKKKSASSKLDEAGRSRHRHSIKRGDRVFENKSPKSMSSNSSSFKSPTPSFKSQGSLNSQIGIGFLLPKKTSVGLRIFSGFQCKGSCFDKKSVYTANNQQVVNQSPKHCQENNDHRKKRLSPQDQFAFPIIDTASPQHNYNKCKIMKDHQHPRKSLEVFGLQQPGKQDIEQNLQRKFSILAWDAIPNSSPNTPLSFPFPTAKKSTTNPIDQKDEYVEIDAMSDASSDLFEIANLSGIAPSESSIQWSVVTASAAEFSMISNDLGDEKIKISKKMVVDDNTTTSKKVPRNSPASGILLGCRNHKAVDVIGNHNTPNNNAYRRTNENLCKFDVKDSCPDIAPSTPSSRKHYALACS